MTFSLLAFLFLTCVFLITSLSIFSLAPVSVPTKSFKPVIPWLPHLNANSKCSLEFIQWQLEQGRQEKLDAQEISFQLVLDKIDAGIAQQVRRADFSSISVHEFQGMAVTSWSEHFWTYPSYSNVLKFLQVYKDQAIFDLAESSISFYVLPWSVHVLTPQQQGTCTDSRHTHVLLTDGLAEDTETSSPRVVQAKGASSSSAFKLRNLDSFHEVSLDDFLSGQLVNDHGQVIPSPFNF